MMNILMFSALFYIQRGVSFLPIFQREGILLISSGPFVTHSFKLIQTLFYLHNSLELYTHVQRIKFILRLITKESLGRKQMKGSSALFEDDVGNDLLFGLRSKSLSHGR